MCRLFQSSLYTHANLYLLLDTRSFLLSEKTLHADASLECELCKLVMEELIKIVGQNKSLVSTYVKMNIKVDSKISIFFMPQP